MVPSSYRACPSRFQSRATRIVRDAHRGCCGQEGRRANAVQSFATPGCREYRVAHRGLWRGSHGMAAPHSSEWTQVIRRAKPSLPPASAGEIVERPIERDVLHFEIVSGQEFAL